MDVDPAISSSPSVPAPMPPRGCLNCGGEKLGDYCHACGQPFRLVRITLATLARELAARMSFERGLFRTFKEMTLRPGTMIRNYLRGQRRSYVNPVTYLLFATGASLLAYQLYKHQVIELMEAQLGNIPANPLLSPDQTEAYTEIMMRVTQQTSWTALILTIPLALLIRLFFHRSGINLAESVVFSLFTLGHAVLLHLILITPLLVLTGQWDRAVWVTFLPYLFAVAFAAAGLFGSPFLSALKAVFALAISFIFYSLVIGVGVLVWVIHFS
jgi:hypothetical protein